MSVPGHGAGCSTRTYPTTCRNCGDRVFFFSCTCGSQVLFDELGEPWPVHDCEFSRSDQRWAQSRKKTRLRDGGLQVELSDAVTATRPSLAPPSERRHGTGASAEQKPHASFQQAIESVPPGADWTVEVAGIIRELDPAVDVYRRLKLARSALGAAFLQELGDGHWGAVTIHARDSVVYSYTAWIPAQLLRTTGIHKRAMVSATLRRLDVPTKARVWVCDAIALE